MLQPPATVAVVASTSEPQLQGSATPIDTNTAVTAPLPAPALTGADPAPASAAAKTQPAAPESAQAKPIPLTQSAQPAAVSDAAVAEPSVKVNANAIAVAPGHAPESLSNQAASAPAPINLEQPTDPGAKPQAGLSSPLPPVSGAQTEPQKRDLPQLPPTAATVAPRPEPLPQATVKPVEATMPLAAVAVAAPAPVPSLATTDSMPVTQDSVQAQPVPPTQSGQPASGTDTAGASSPLRSTRMPGWHPLRGIPSRLPGNRQRLRLRLLRFSP